MISDQILQASWRKQMPVKFSKFLHQLLAIELLNTEIRQCLGSLK